MPQRGLQQADPAKLARISIEFRRAEEELLDDGLTLIVALQKRDGSQLMAQRRSAKGELRKRFTDADRRQKFTDCCQALSDATSL